MGIQRACHVSQLRLPFGTGRVREHQVDVVAEGSLILIAGDVTTTTTKVVGTGRAKAVRTVTSQASGAWLSRDGGSTWMAAVSLDVPPPGHGAQPQIVGAAVVQGGFVLLLPTAGTRPGLDVYGSPNGTAWTFEATLTTPAGLVAGLADGGPSGAVVTGQAGRTLIAFISANGVSWRQTQTFGAAAAESVSGVAMAGGSAVVTATRSLPAEPPACHHHGDPWRPRPPGRCGEYPRRLRPPARRQRHRGGQWHPGRGGQRQRLPGRLDVRRRRQLMDPRHRRRPGGLRPARRAAADRRDARPRRVARGRRRHLGRRPASGRPFLG